MCKKVEAVLAEGVNMDPKCEVVMDGVGHVSDDFVCVMSRENGDASLFYNTDALTLGMAMKMVTRAFVEAMNQLPEDERKSVTDILGGADIVDKPQEATE